MDENIDDENEKFSDDEEYFSAEEDDVEMEIPLSRDVATQTDTIMEVMEVSACMIM